MKLNTTEIQMEIAREEYKKINRTFHELLDLRNDKLDRDTMEHDFVTEALKRIFDKKREAKKKFADLCMDYLKEIFEADTDTDTEMLFEDTIIDKVGMEGLEVLRDFGLIEPYGYIRDYRLYAIK